MKKTNVCVDCPQKHICQFYDPSRTNCVPVRVGDWGQYGCEQQTHIDWIVYKAEVAKIMLPIIYRELSNNGNLVSNREQQAVDAAADIAERLERRLRK